MEEGDGQIVTIIQWRKARDTYNPAPLKFLKSPPHKTWLEGLWKSAALIDLKVRQRPVLYWKDISLVYTTRVRATLTSTGSFL